MRNSLFLHSHRLSPRSCLHNGGNSGGGGGGGGSASSPPSFGELFSAEISANMTQVGYDAGLVIVNFTASCPSDPTAQKMKTVYGDFYTVLTRCDLGKEYTIAPASRGGACVARTIGKDVNARICSACGCPFCVRDTNGTYTTGEVAGQKTKTVWQTPVRTFLDGRNLLVYKGRAQGSGSFDLETTVAFDSDSGFPVAVNVSHPLWITTAAKIDGFTRDVDEFSAFAIPTVAGASK